MTESIDSEILQLIGKLNKIQDEVGTIDGSRKRRRGKHGAGDTFHDLKDQMMDKLQGIHESLESAQRLEKQPGSNPRELIAVQAKIRGDLAVVNDDWKDLDALFRKEAKKRRSKLSPEELALRQKTLAELQMEIQGVREAMRAGHNVGYQRAQLPTLAESDLFKVKDGDQDLPRPKGVHGARNNDMTDGQHGQLLKVRERDALIDQEIERLGEGVDELHEIARAQNEEVKLQSAQLTALESKIDGVHDKVFNVNQRLKSTIEEVRSSDKICLDIFCVLILVGMIIVVVKVTTNA